MHALLLFAGSFALVFLLTIQQHNVSAHRHIYAAVNSAAIGAVTIVNIRLGGQSDSYEICAFIAAQPLATVLSMQIGNRLNLESEQKHHAAPMDNIHTSIGPGIEANSRS